jgi:hypothetical protein
VRSREVAQEALAPNTDDEARDLDEETADKLRTLGYLE